MPYKDREKRNQWFKEKMRRQRRDPLFRQKEYARKHEKNANTIGICEVCGFSEVFDVHHEGNQTHILCPNCHALITRGKKTLADILANPSVIPKPVNPVIPKLEAMGLKMDGNRVLGVKKRRRDQMTAEELGITDHDADGYPIYEE